MKRRGRAQDEFESDEDIVREVRTDSDTDDDNSSIDSDSDSESTSSDLHADAHSEVVTPSTTQSPPPAELDRLPNVAVKDPSSSQAGIFADATNWAEMVAGEAENGAAELPVIDFADMASSRLPEPRVPSPAHRSRKSHKSGKKSATVRATSAPPPPTAPSPQPELAEEQSQDQEPVASTSHEPHPRSAFPSRSRGQTARQAYQQRLESDPSFVPKVGEFWGHDDRLLDKDLRSLSGWWRGRWQSRGRGRGAFNMRGRGRGGFFPNRPFPRDDGVAPEEPADVPPVERPWTHDGFEEMKRRDERRRALQEQQQTNAPPQRGFGFRGRGFVPARGRAAFARGGSPVATQPPLTSNVSMGDRVWYAQKPERMWTKQHDIFLYNDAATKPRPGVGPGVRVRLPGGKAPLIVRLPPRTPAARASDKPEAASSQLDAEKPIIVRMPAAAGKTKAVEETFVAPGGAEELATTVEELSIEEVFTVRPNVVPNRRIDLSVPPSSAPTAPASQAIPGKSSTPPPPRLSQPEEGAPRNPIEQLSTLPTERTTASPSVQIQETILRNPPAFEDADSSPSATVPGEESQSRPEPPVLHPLQTSFSPAPPPTSPPYGSPYGYPPALPPGVGVNSQGMAYEYATGRPVYIQPTPPPMYTPRPMMHGHHPSMSIPFVPSHLRHHSTASPDFLAHPHTPHAHTPIQSFVDPATGVPIFSPARQSSRIEIRAPTDAEEGKKAARASHQRSNLSVAYSAEGSQASYYPQQGHPAEDRGGSDEASSQPPVGHAHTPSMDSSVNYAPYPQPYYYPEQYGYAPYVDMSQQMVHYEMYPPEQQHPHSHHQHHPSQPIVYY